jgi:hypothetical protein
MYESMTEKKGLGAPAANAPGRTTRRGKKPGPKKGSQKAKKTTAKNALIDVGAATGAGMGANAILKQVPTQGGWLDTAAPAALTAGGAYGLTKATGVVRMLVLGATTVAAYRTAGAVAKQVMGSSDDGTNGLGLSEGTKQIVADFIPTSNADSLNGLGELAEVEDFDMNQELNQIDKADRAQQMGLPAGVSVPSTSQIEAEQQTDSMV